MTAETAPDAPIALNSGWSLYFIKSGMEDTAMANRYISA